MERLIVSSMSPGTSVIIDGTVISSRMSMRIGRQKNWNGYIRQMPIGLGGYAESNSIRGGWPRGSHP